MIWESLHQKYLKGKFIIWKLHQYVSRESLPRSLCTLCQNKGNCYFKLSIKPSIVALQVQPLLAMLLTAFGYVIQEDRDADRKPLGGTKSSPTEVSYPGPMKLKLQWIHQETTHPFTARPVITTASGVCGSVRQLPCGPTTLSREQTSTDRVLPSFWPLQPPRLSVVSYLTGYGSGIPANIPEKTVEPVPRVWPPAPV